MSALLLFPSAFYLGDPCKNRWNEKASSTARQFSKGDLLYLNFSELEELCSYFTVMFFILFKTVTIWYFSKKAAKNCSSFIFLTSRHFQLGGLRKTNLSTFWETYIGFIENVFLQLFSKYYKSILISRLKVAKNLTAHIKCTGRIKVASKIVSNRNL